MIKCVDNKTFEKKEGPKPPEKTPKTHIHIMKTLYSVLVFIVVFRCCSIF